MSSEEFPLKCIIEDGVIKISIGVDVLRFAAETHPTFWQKPVAVTDPATFAQEVAKVLNYEEEDGSTLITGMLDDAILRTVEDGCEGIDLED